MNVTSGNVAKNWSYCRESWNDYKIATDFREKNEKFSVATVRAGVPKLWYILTFERVNYM